MSSRPASSSSVRSRSRRRSGAEIRVVCCWEMGKAATAAPRCECLFTTMYNYTVRGGVSTPTPDGVVSRGAFPIQVHDYSVFRIKRLQGQKTDCCRCQEELARALLALALPCGVGELLTVVS